MATWTVPAFLDELKTRLEARVGLAGVNIHTAPMGTDTGAQAITFHDVDGAQEWAALGNQRKDDEFTVRGTIWSVKPGEGNTVAKQARDRAAALLAELEAELKNGFSTVNGNQITRLNLADISLDQGANPDGRVAQVTFSINVAVRI